MTEGRNVKINILFIVVLILILINISLFYLDFKNSSRGFTFAMLDIGQGDGIFVESPTGTQVLIDAGPPRKILGELSRLMSPFDRRIDAIIVTNPDLDHIGGFMEVLKTYKVDAFFEPGTFNESKTYKNLKEEVKNKKIEEFLARRGMQLNLGGGVTIDILFPDRDVSTWTTNDGSVVGKLTYGETEIMLMGDSTEEVEKIVLAENSKSALDVDILKVGHHGSKTSTSANFVETISPEYALISVGNNSYGHPHQNVLDTLAKFGVEVLRTDLLGTIVVKSDGKMLRWEHARQTKR